MATIDQYKIKIDVDGAQQVDRLKNSLNGLGTLIAGIGFGAFVKGVLEMADAITDLADATGLAVGDIAAFQGALQQAGGRAEDAGKMLAAFYQHIDKAAQGSEEAQKALERVGISLKDLETLSERELLAKALKTLREMPAGAERTAAGIEALSKAFRNINPAILEEALRTGDFSKAEEALKKMGDLADSLAANMRTLQIAGAQAFSDILTTLEPFIGKVEEGRLRLDQAEKIVKALGIALAIVFSIKTITMIAEMAAALIIFNKRLAETEIISRLLGKNPLWKIIAGAAVALGVGAYAFKEYEDAIRDAEKAQKDLAKSTPDVADPNKPKRKVQRLTDKELEQLQKEALAAQETTKQIQKQNEAANAYQTIINGTIGTLDEQAARVKLNADIDRDAANQKAALLKQIQIEENKGRLRNQEVIDELNKQIDLVNRQANDRKILGAVELTNLEIEKQRKNLISQNAEKIKMQIGDAQALAEAELARQLVAGQITEQQKKDYTDYIKIATDGAKNLADLQKQLDQSTSTIEKNNIMELMNLEAERTRRAIEGKKEEIRQRNELEQSYQAGVVKALEKIADQYKPINMAQEAIGKGWGRISDAIDTFVDTGKFKFSDFARSVIADLAKMIAKAAIFQAISAALGFFGLKIPGLAEGGPVKQNQPYVVGEKGPELFVPKSAGDIIPNKDMAKPSMAMSSDKGPTNAPITNNYNTYNINALDAKSVAQMFAENRKAIFGANKMAEREMSYAGVR
jgi:lambda family phage tail tape measure protein